LRADAQRYTVICEEPFNPEAFDLAATNAALQHFR
jgi:hypothetical protein